MKHEILTCDTCVTITNVKPYRIDTGSEMDPSGNGYNTNWKYIDLCPQCYYKLKAQTPNIKIYGR